VSQLVRGEGIVQVADAKELENKAKELLANPEKRAALAANGAKCFTAHRGATARTCAAILAGREPKAQLEI
jgi:3-deoxy-D-manno-octulosonic-acid transferase